MSSEFLGKSCVSLDFELEVMRTSCFVALIEDCEKEILLGCVASGRDFTMICCHTRINREHSGHVFCKPFDD